MSAWGYWVLVLAGLVALVYLLDKLFAWAARGRDLEDDEPLAQVHRLERAREAIRRQTSQQPRWYPLDEPDDEWPLTEHPTSADVARWNGLSLEDQVAMFDRARRARAARPEPDAAEEAGR